MIELSRAAYDEIVYQAYDGDDQEVCGLLAGAYDQDHTVVTDAYPAENAAETPEIRYAIDPEEQFELTERIEDAGREVAGFYHSHPAGPTQPSETDADRATWPDFSYVIVALARRRRDVRTRRGPGERGLDARGGRQRQSVTLISGSSAVPSIEQEAVYSTS